MLVQIAAMDRSGIADQRWRGAIEWHAVQPGGAVGTALYAPGSFLTLEHCAEVWLLRRRLRLVLRDPDSHEAPEPVKTVR